MFNHTKEKRKKNDNSMRVEIIIMIIIAICIVFLISFTNSKFEEFDQREEAMVLMHPNQEANIDEDLAKNILAFRPDACKLIELYDENFQSVFKVTFTDDSNDSKYSDLTEYPELMNLFIASPQGHTSFEIDDNTEDIVYEWTESSDGNQYLLIVYMSRPIVRNTWIFSFVCYLILILVFTLIARMMFRQNRVRIKHYESLSRM